MESTKLQVLRNREEDIIMDNEVSRIDSIFFLIVGVNSKNLSPKIKSCVLGFKTKIDSEVA